MPYKIVKTAHGFGVMNTETGEMKSHDTTHENATAQMRLLYGVEHHTIDKKTGKTKRSADK